MLTKSTDSMRLTIDETNRRREKQVGIQRSNMELLRNKLKRPVTLSVFGNANRNRRAAERRYTCIRGTFFTPNIAADPVVQYMSKTQTGKKYGAYPQVNAGSS